MFYLEKQTKHCKTVENIQKLKSTFELISERSKRLKSPTYGVRRAFEGALKGETEGCETYTYNDSKGQSFET